MDLAIATMTMVRTPDEAELLRRAVGLLAGLRVPLAVADAGTNEQFTRFLEELPGVTLCRPEGPGLVKQIQAGIARAAGFNTRVILYTESDKEWFFRHALQRFLDRAAAAEADVVLAARSHESLSTYPGSQQYAEGVINHLCGESFGAPGDYSYGPFTMPRGLAPTVATLRPDLGWGWRHATFASAHRSGLGISHATDDYPCPVDQRTDDAAERTHRIRQLSQNLLGLVE